MIRFDEHMIERYVRYPDTLSEEAQRSIEAYVQQDASAQTLAEFYRSFYQELDNLPQQAPHRVDAFVESLFPAPPPR